MHRKALILIGSALAITSFASLADNHSSKTDIDCAVLLEQDYSIVPVAIGYVVAKNSITEIDQLDPVEVDDIYEACQKNPKSKVSDVAKKEVKD